MLKILQKVQQISRVRHMWQWSRSSPSGESRSPQYIGRHSSSSILHHFQLTVPCFRQEYGRRCCHLRKSWWRIRVRQWQWCASCSAHSVMMMRLDQFELDFSLQGEKNDEQPDENVMNEFLKGLERALALPSTFILPAGTIDDAQYNRYVRYGRAVEARACDAEPRQGCQLALGILWKRHLLRSRLDHDPDVPGE